MSEQKLIDKIKSEGLVNPLEVTDKTGINIYWISLNTNIINTIYSLNGNDLKVLIFMLMNKQEDLVVLNKTECAYKLNMARITIYSCIERLKELKLIAETTYSNVYFISKNLLR